MAATVEKADGKGAQTRGEHLVEGVEVGDTHELRVAGVVDKPRALAHVGQQQTALNERPGGIDVAAAHMAHVGIERLGTGGSEEAAAQIMMPAWLLGLSRKAMPRNGLRHSSTAGYWQTKNRPVPPKNKNHSVMMGPKA